MSDALDLIAEARARQEAAERDRDVWRSRAQFERRRCRAVIDMAKRRPVHPPELDEQGRANWEQLSFTVDRFAEVIADPYAVFADKEEPGPTHETIKMMMTYRLQDMIAAAVKLRVAALEAALSCLLNYVDRFKDRPDINVASEIRSARDALKGTT